MDKKKIGTALITLFKAKNKPINNENKLVIQKWVELIERYNLTEEQIIKAIDRLIITETPYGIEFANIVKYATDNTPDKLNEKVHSQWYKIIRQCRGNKDVDIDPVANKCFLMITDYERYGYSESEFEKSRWERSWKELYQQKLETENVTMIENSVKGLLDG